MAVVLVFAGIHAAIAAEKEARGAAARSEAFAGGPLPELVPLPSSVKSDCGFGLLVEGAAGLDDPRLAAILDPSPNGGGIAFAAAYRMNEKEHSYERID